MKTVEIGVYQFDELSESAKEKARESFRNDGIDTKYNWDEAEKSVEAFHNIFQTSTGHRSWLDFTSQYDEAIEELTGQRLATYIWNNYKTDLFQGKYYSLWSKTEKSFKHYKDGFPVLKRRHSRVFLTNCCVLTGVCWDEDLLQPFYEFLKTPDSRTILDLIEEGFNNLRNTLERSDEYEYSDEGIEAQIEANEYEFLESGERY